MKKMWIKKDNIYYKPFYKQKLKMGLLIVIIVAVFFFSYQIFCMEQLDSPEYQTSNSRGSNDSKNPLHNNSAASSLRGVQTKYLELYSSTFQNDTFKCLMSGVRIAFSRVNDDYCDCEEDGSDEPSTNACANGKFYCRHSMRPIPSSFVNDGICDCCDGSDEWLTDVRTSSCPNTCKT